MSNTLLANYLTPSELSGLSAQNRALVQAIRIISSESTKVFFSQMSGRDSNQEISPALVGFECVHCSLSPEASTIREKSKRLNKVFPGSIESMGASLELLREKHFSADAAEMQQRCQLLPLTAREIFDSAPSRKSIFDKAAAAAARESSSSYAPDANLHSCCQLVTGRLGLTSKEPESMEGIIFLSFTAGPGEHSMMGKSEKISTEEEAWSSGYREDVSFSCTSTKNLNLLADNASLHNQSSTNPLHMSESTGSKVRFSPKTSTRLPYLHVSIVPRKINAMEIESAITAPKCDKTEAESATVVIMSAISGTKSEEIERKFDLSELKSEMEMLRSEMTTMKTKMKSMKSEMAGMKFEKREQKRQKLNACFLDTFIGLHYGND